MKKRAEINSGEILIIGIIALIISLTFVLGIPNARTASGLTYFSFNEDVTNLYNITINDSDTAQVGNITQVNITFSSSNFLFSRNTNGTNTLFASFTNTSTVLNWLNTTELIHGGANNNYFWFNATVNTPGTYSILVTTRNSTNTTTINFTVTINDTTPPTITFVNLVSMGNYSRSQNFNISTSDNVNATSVFLNITNSTSGQVNYSRATNLSRNTAGVTYWNLTINTSIFADGRYNITVYANDSANNTNNSMRIQFNIDNTAPPNISFSNGNPSNNGNFSSLYINITTSETNQRNIVFNVYYRNLSGCNGTLANSTNVSSTIATSTIITGLRDGNYTYNVTIYDQAGNKNTTITSRNVTIDSVDPVIAFSCTPTTLTKSGTVTCTCTAPDAGVGLLGIPSFTQYPTVEYGTYTVYCTAGDNAGNNASASQTYTVSSGGSSGGSGGGGSTITKTYSPSESQLSAGYTNELKSNERVKLTIASQTHYVAVTAVTTTSATISVSSTPQTATLNIGETKKFDVTGDGYYDLSVKLNEIKANKADITVKSIHEEIPASAESAPSETEQAATTTGELPEETPTNLTWLWIVIIVVVVLALIVIIYKYNKK